MSDNIICKVIWLIDNWIVEVYNLQRSNKCSLCLCPSIYSFYAIYSYEIYTYALFIVHIIATYTYIAILLSSHTSSTYLISCTINLFHHKVSTPTHYSTSLVLIPRNNLSIFSLKYTTLDNILCCMPNIVYQMFTLSSSHSQFLLKNRFQPKCSYRGVVRVW